MAAVNINRKNTKNPFNPNSVELKKPGKDRLEEKIRLISNNGKGNA
jgi:hypothetical protein